jgi:hypothetical protein
VIKALVAMCKDVFVGGSVSYAYTTIPTYPRSATTCHCKLLPLPASCAVC